MTGTVDINNITEQMNYNAAIGTSFQVKMSRFPNLDYFAQSIGVPQISIGVANTQYRNRQAKMPGNKITYEDFGVTYILDEDFKVYSTFKDWMMLSADAIDSNIPTRIAECFSDVEIFFTNSNKVTTHGVVIKDAFITSIGQWSLSNAVTNSSVIIFQVNFAFQRYDFITLPNPYSS